MPISDMALNGLVVFRDLMCVCVGGGGGGGESPFPRIFVGFKYPRSHMAPYFCLLNVFGVIPVTAIIETHFFI